MGRYGDPVGVQTVVKLVQNLDSGPDIGVEDEAAEGGFGLQDLVESGPAGSRIWLHRGILPHPGQPVKVSTVVIHTPRHTPSPGRLVEGTCSSVGQYSY